MAVEFDIVAGQLKMDKRLFLRELLSPRSLLKSFLNYQMDQMDKKRFLSIDKERDPQWVIIEFKEGSDVALGEDYQDLIKALKEKYQEKVKGRLTLSAFYYHNMTITLDLDSHSDRVKEINRSHS